MAQEIVRKFSPPACLPSKKKPEKTSIIKPLKVNSLLLLLLRISLAGGLKQQSGKFQTRRIVNLHGDDKFPPEESSSSCPPRWIHRKVDSHESLKTFFMQFCVLNMLKLWQPTVGWFGGVWGGRRAHTRNTTNSRAWTCTAKKIIVISNLSQIHDHIMAPLENFSNFSPFELCFFSFFVCFKLQLSYSSHHTSYIIW